MTSIWTYFNVKKISYALIHHLSWFDKIKIIDDYFADIEYFWFLNLFLYPLKFHQFLMEMSEWLWES